MPEINEYGYEEHQILEVEGFQRAPSSFSAIPGENSSFGEVSGCQHLKSYLYATACMVASINGNPGFHLEKSSRKR